MKKLLTMAVVGVLGLSMVLPAEAGFGDWSGRRLDPPRTNPYSKGTFLLRSTGNPGEDIIVEHNEWRLVAEYELEAMGADLMLTEFHLRNSATPDHSPTNQADLVVGLFTEDGTLLMERVMLDGEVHFVFPERFPHVATGLLIREGREVELRVGVKTWEVGPEGPTGRLVRMTVDPDFGFMGKELDYTKH